MCFTISEIAVKKKMMKRRQLHVPWTSEEKRALFAGFKNYLQCSSNRLPGKRVIEEAIQKFPVLEKRTWKNIKFQLKNLQGKYMKSKP